MAGITQNTQLQYYTYNPPPPHTHTHTHTHTPQDINTQVPVSLSACIYEELIQWYIFSYYCTGLHKYCIVNVKDCNTYLYIFLSESFDPDTVPLKWDLHNCFNVILCFTKTRLIMPTRLMLMNTCLSASICSRSWWRRITLFALTISTMASSCCWVNRRCRPPPEGLLVIL